MHQQSRQQNLYLPQPEDYFHGITLGIAWLGCEHIAIWSLYLRNTYRYAVKLHALAMVMLTILTALGTATMITYQGLKIITKNYFHNLFGFILVCLIPIAIVLGVISKEKQESQNVSPKAVDNYRMIHVIFGWLLIAATRVPLYDQTSRRFPYTFLIMVVCDLSSHLLYFYKKSTQLRMESISNNGAETKQIAMLPQIKNQADLEYYKGDYFIFADLIYRLGPLLTSHPGGYQIIDRIRGRQVDRFIYGMEPLETLDLQVRVSHTAASFYLLGQPIGKLETPALYPKMKQLTSSKISTIMFYEGSKKIYTIYLTPLSRKYEQFYYTGYTHISQLGKYFALTAHKKKTRLYTMVNFLQRKSVNLMEKITKGQIFDEQEKKLLNQHLVSFREGDHYKSIVQWSQIFDGNKPKKQHNTYQEVKIVSELLANSQHVQYEVKQNYQNKIQRNNIPLLIKKYQDGQFTPFFLKNNFCGSLKLSKPRGRGLALQDVIIPGQNGFKNIVMFSGGTGIYPYADFIDLLFKQLIIQQGNSYSSAILKLDPILKQKPFKNMFVTLYISVVMVQQMHPITLFQCQYLVLHKRIKVFLKSKREGDHKIIKRRYPHIVILEDRYEKILEKIAESEVSMVYLCGPTRMTKAMIEKLEDLRWNPKKYLIV